MKNPSESPLNHSKLNILSCLVTSSEVENFKVHKYNRNCAAVLPAFKALCQLCRR